MGGIPTDPSGSQTFSLNGDTVTIINQYYVDNFIYYDLQYSDGSVRTHVPASSLSANPAGIEAIANEDTD